MIRRHDRDVRLIETRAAAEHAGVDAARVHHAHMRAEIGKERVEQIMRIAVAIEIDGEFAGFAFEQFRRRVVLLKIDEHGLSVPSFRDCRQRVRP